MDTDVEKARCTITENAWLLLREFPSTRLAIEVVASIADVIRIERRLADPVLDIVVAVAPLERG